jgi:fimbrial chaperone protein
VGGAKSLARLAGIALLGWIAQAAIAGSFEVNPIRIDLSAATRSAALTVRNNGTEPVVVQVSVQSWSQQGGADVLGATNDVLASPPIATIAPDKEQIVRVGLRRAPDAGTELSYRLFLQEVPPPPRPGFQGLQVALRVGLPIFVQPTGGPAKAALTWNAELRDDRTIALRVENRGSGHVQISDVQLFAAGGKEPIAAVSQLVYVLPGQSRDWSLKLTREGVNKNDTVQLKVSTDAGAIDTRIGLAP